MTHHIGLEMNTIDFEQLWDQARLRFDKEKHLRNNLGVTRSTIHNIKTGKTEKINLNLFSGLISIVESSQPRYDIKKAAENPLRSRYVSEANHPGNSLTYYDLEPEFRKYIFSRVKNEGRLGVSPKTIQNYSNAGADSLIRKELYDECVRQLGEGFEEVFSISTPSKKPRLVNNSNLPQHSDLELLENPEISGNEARLLGMGGIEALEFMQSIEQSFEEDAEDPERITRRRLANAAILENGAEIYDQIRKAHLQDFSNSFHQDIPGVTKRPLKYALDALENLGVVENYEGGCVRSATYTVNNIEYLEKHENVFHISNLT